jgi:AAA+ superfamily predicted ATPase
MESDPGVVASLCKAVEAMPDDVPLRLHLAAMLLAAGQHEEAIRHLGAALQRNPASSEALGLLQAATDNGAPATTRLPGPGQPPGPPRRPEITRRPGSGPGRDHGPAQPHGPAQSPAAPLPTRPARGGDPAAPGEPPAGGGPQPRDATQPHDATQPPDQPVPPGAGYDWAEGEAELSGVLPPMFVTPAGAPDGGGAADYHAERPGLRLEDVAGMADVKQRLEAAFLAPMRSPELRRLYGKSLRGGLLLYGPPGCGKTFIARAVAGELGAHFMAISFHDVIDMFVGQSERNIHEMFAIARRNAPCVLFLDEVDAIGQKRSQLRSTPMRTAVNQLLLELDDVTGASDGVFVLAATNHPWDVDSALRRPGRFDRTLLVLPPDGPAREAVFRFHLRHRPVAGIDLARLARLTEGYSGADIAHICESASELALMDSARTGAPRMIGQPDLEAAAAQVRPSLGPWFDAARNVALFANEGGSYDDLAAYLKQRRML